MELLPASAVFASFVQVLVRLPCRFRVPPESMMPRSPMPIICSFLTLSVRVMVALCANGLASVPTSSSPCTMTHSVVSSRSDLSAKVSLPLMVRPPNAGGLTSRITSLPLAISTFSPATGTFLLGQVARSDQRVALAGCAASTAATLPRSSAGTSNARKNGRICCLMSPTPTRNRPRSLSRRRIARASGTGLYRERPWRPCYNVLRSIDAGLKPVESPVHVRVSPPVYSCRRNYCPCRVYGLQARRRERQDDLQHDVRCLPFGAANRGSRTGSQPAGRCRLQGRQPAGLHPVHPRPQGLQDHLEQEGPRQIP